MALLDNGELPARYCTVPVSLPLTFSPSTAARFWLTITPPLPNDTQAAAQLKGRERFEGFVEALGRRLQKGQNFLREIPDDIISQKLDEPGG